MASKRSIKPFAFTVNVEGTNKEDGVFRIQPSSAELIQNLHPNKAGEYTAYNQGNIDYSPQLESGARIDSLGSFTNDSGSAYFVCATNGKVLNINISTGANDGTITTSNTPNYPVDFQAFKGSLYIVEKSMDPEKWTGSGSATSASGWPIVVGGDTYEKPSMVEAYANRLVFGNFNGSTKFPSHIAISNDLSPETFTLSPTSTATNGAVVQISPGDGQHLRAMRSIYIPSEANSYLILFKDKSIYAFTGNSPETFNLSIVSSSFGALNNNCVATVGSDLIFIDRQNIYSLSGATQSGTLQPVAIGSEKVQDILSTLNQGSSDKAWVMHIPSKYEVWFGIPTGSSTEVNTILVYNYRKAEKEGQHVWIVRTGMSATCATEYMGTLYTGNTTGYMQKWFTKSNYNGTGYNWIYRYPFYNFGTEAQNKRIVECFGYFLIRKNTTVNVRVTWRLGGNNITKTFTRTLVMNEGSLYGTARYGAAVYGTPGGLLKKIKLPIVGNGEQVQIEISGTTDTLGPTFLGIGGLVEFGGYSRSYK